MGDKPAERAHPHHLIESKSKCGTGMPPFTNQTRTECLGTDTKGQEQARPCFQIHHLSALSPAPFAQSLRTGAFPPRKIGPIQTEQFRAPLGWVPSPSSISLPITHPSHPYTHPPKHASCFHLHDPPFPATLHHVPPIHLPLILSILTHLLPVLSSSTPSRSTVIPRESPVTRPLSIHPTSYPPPLSTLRYFTHPSSAHPPTHLCA